ncbi:MAG: N-acetyl-gamma-glutamyl-phosphate reductase [Chloroflexota bacterium]|nr:N-acetyl-gamma-glutamyl-phosphate reductase [Chloroflexota bacterium]MEC8712935.1 N-acetyl-gamma-glutamyl-phosphate reductase [Chloroflexota bacterium]
MKKIGIINITSYSGLELLRILKMHPEVEITQVTGRSMAGEKLSNVFNFYNGDLVIQDELKDSVDLIFSCLPHKASAEVIGKFVNNEVNTVDLSADFRLPVEIYESTYESKHPYPSLINKFVYGLPELNKKKISSSKFISNPGCFPTCGTIPLIPLIGKDIVNIIIDAKTGISGAGRSKKIEHNFSEISDNFSAYSLNGHRHEPEIENNLNFKLHLTTHLAPMVRGIFSTIYFQSKEKIDIDEYINYFSEHPFVNVLSESPKVKDVRGTNNCNLYFQELKKNNDLNSYRIISVIDNLTKGASGQAVQNMNLLFDFEETLGLNNMSLYP